MDIDTKPTYCRLCEAWCGLIATVEDGVVTKLRPDKENPISQGAVCPKGIAFVEIQNDPQRVLYPLRRRAGVPHDADLEIDELFERVTWDEALSDIGAKVRKIISAHGGKSVGAWQGNGAGHSYSAGPAVGWFVQSLGSLHHYGVGSQDHSSRFTANAFLYGDAFVLPMPDLARTDLLVIVGANPLVSHGSLMSDPRIKERLRDIVGRGGRVVAVDPRRTETARAYEHIPVRPDTDAWMLLSILNVIFEESLENRDVLSRTVSGADELRAVAAQHPPEQTQDRTGIPPETVRELARALATTQRAAIYGRVGTCRGRHGTLTSFLIDAVNIVTGHLDTPGGSVFGVSVVAPSATKEYATVGKRRTRIGNLPEVFGYMPSSQVAEEIRTPGEGQLRALFVVGANPVHSSPGGDDLEQALGELDLHVSIDLYVSDTGRHADYVLPATSWLEREDTTLILATFFQTPYVGWFDPVVPPRGEAREESQILDEVARKAGFISGPTSALRFLRRFGINVSPARLIDIAYRTGPYGDRFGLRRNGISMKKLKKLSRGKVLETSLPTGVLSQKIKHPDGRICLNPPELMKEVERLGTRHDADEHPDFPLRMISGREMRGANSWLHNSPKLMSGRKHGARINPEDAASLGVSHGQTIRITSKTASMELGAVVTDDIVQGTVWVPHGWGHRSRGWSIARAAQGGNYNRLASTRLEDIEAIAGMSLLDGIPVRVEPLGSSVETDVS